MARLDLMPAHVRDHLLALPCTPFETAPWVTGPPLHERKVALISTAGLQRRGDRPFGVGAADYRLIASDTLPADLVMSHISTNFDRTGFQQDWNVVFPLERLRALVAAGEIGSLAQYHYSFMGATDPVAMEPRARELAQIMKTEGVNAVLLVPV
jgi:D-proline reductase (dithiol) PrdB